MISPPIEGPRASPTATATPTKPNARPRSCGGNVWVMMAGPTANSMPAPRACRPRNAIKAQMLHDRAQASDPSVKPTNPAM